MTPLFSAPGGPGRWNAPFPARHKEQDRQCHVVVVARTNLGMDSPPKHSMNKVLYEQCTLSTTKALYYSANFRMIFKKFLGMGMSWPRWKTCWYSSQWSGLQAARS